MDNKQQNIKVTRNGRILRMKDMFEVISDAEKIWEKPYRQGDFEYGKGFVLFADRECGTITYVIHNLMPVPMHIRDIAPQDFNKVYGRIRREFANQGFFEMKAKCGVYVDDVSNEIKQEIIQQMKMYGYKTQGVR